MKKAWLLLLILVALFGFSGSAGASLTLIGTANYSGQNYNLIYMDDGPFGPVTWLDYTNSRTTWQNQVDWAAGLGSNLTVTLSPLYVMDIDWGTGWRLPNTVDGPYVRSNDGSTSWGYNITTSEMGYLYYEALDNKGYRTTDGSIQPGWGLNNTGDFNSLKADYYWSGTEQAWSPNSAWHFRFSHGLQDLNAKSQNQYALAVRPGAVVPLPGAVWLLASGLIGLVGFRKKFKKS